MNSKSDIAATPALAPTFDEGAAVSARPDSWPQIKSPRNGTRYPLGTFIVKGLVRSDYAGWHLVWLELPLGVFPAAWPVEIKAVGQDFEFKLVTPHVPEGRYALALTGLDPKYNNHIERISVRFGNPGDDS